MTAGMEDMPKSGFTRKQSKNVPQNFFPGEDKERRKSADSPQEDRAPERPVSEQDLRPAEKEQPPPERARRPPDAGAASSRRTDKELRAYDADGPVEAVGLQADAEFWQIFEDTKTLGRGHFAKVKLVSHLQTHEDFAAKILDKTLADNDIEDLVREFQMLRSLRHRNIIRLYAAYETPKKLYLVTELASGGELMKRLGSDNSVYSEDEVKLHVRTILRAIQYMHHKNSVHRDLKPENVLLSDMSDDAEIKIVDLGLSRYFEERKLMRTICGTHKYLAPELVQCDRGQLQGYDKAIDMWGIGLLTFIMLYGFNPFAREVQRETHNAIVRATFSFPDGYNLSKDAQNFVDSCLRLKAQDRLTADEALAHRWLSAEAPASPGSILSNEKRPVKSMLSEFNAQRMIGKMIKGAHRRLSSDSTKEGDGKPPAKQ